MTLKPDVIVTWPRSCDFPKWRAQMDERRDDFGKIICVISDNIRPVRYDYSGWLEANFPATWVKPYDGDDGDWYTKCVNTGLAHSRSEWVMFTEQDFFYRRFEWFQIIRQEQSCGIRDGVRWHPCFFLARRETINQTDRYFGVTEEGDCFTHFGNQIDALTTVTDVGAVDWYTHMQGLTESSTHVDRGTEPTSNPDAFKAYLLECLDCGMALHPEWERIARHWLG